MTPTSRALVTLMLTLLASCGSGTASQAGSDEASTTGSRGWFARTPELQVSNIALTAMQEHNDTFTVTANVESDGPGVVLRVEGREYPLHSRDGTAYSFGNVVVPKIGANNAKLIVGSDDASPNTAAFTITREMRPIDEYRKYAEPLNYKQLEKNADKYAGKIVKGRGKIYQIDETAEGGMTYNSGGVYVTNKGYGFWDDNVRFGMVGETDFVSDDIVAFYGEVVGNYSYETQAGWNMTVPMIKVAFMEK
jgi:hypothetical protein